MQNKKIINKIIVSNRIYNRLRQTYNDIAIMYDKYLSDDIKEMEYFISHVPGDGLCMHLNYDAGYIAPLSFINEYLFDKENKIITLDDFLKLTI